MHQYASLTNISFFYVKIYIHFKVSQLLLIYFTFSLYNTYE